MEKFVWKRLISLIVCTAVVYLILNQLQKVGMVSPRGLGISLALWVGVIAAVVAFTLREARNHYWAGREWPERSIDDATRKRRVKAVRRLKGSIVFLQLILWYGLWESRGQPLLPVLVGVTVNLCFTALMILAVVRGQKTLDLPRVEDES